MVREEAGDAIVDLLSALAQVLIIILIGFTSAKLKIIPPGAAAGIGLVPPTTAAAGADLTHCTDRGYFCAPSTVPAQCGGNGH